MSTLSVTTINTADGTTDLTVKTGNTSGPGIVARANGSALVLQSNSTVNAVNIISSGNVGIGTANPIAELTVTPSSNGVDTILATTSDGARYITLRPETSANTGSIGYYNGSAFANLNVNAHTTAVSGNLTAVSANLSSNTFFLGSTANTANGYAYLPGGVKLAWGSQSASVNVATTATATFAAAFTTLYSYSVTILGREDALATVANSTVLVWRNAQASAAAANTLYYWAIGV